jgi:hypothetical protein
MESENTTGQKGEVIDTSSANPPPPPPTEAEEREEQNATKGTETVNQEGDATAKLAAKLATEELQKEADRVDKQNEEKIKGKTQEPAAQKTCVVTKKYKDLDDNQRYVHGEKIFTKGEADEEKPDDDDDVYVKFDDQEGGKRKKRKTAKKSRKTKKKARKTGKKARKTGKKARKTGKK